MPTTAEASPAAEGHQAARPCAAATATPSGAGRDVGTTQGEVVEERVPSAAEQDGKHDMQNIKRAASHRCKRRVTREDGSEAPRDNIAPQLVACHKKNRKGMTPNTDMFHQLLSWYVGQWGPDEAGHQCVAVQTKPQ